MESELKAALFPIIHAGLREQRQTARILITFQHFAPRPYLLCTSTAIVTHPYEREKGPLFFVRVQGHNFAGHSLKRPSANMLAWTAVVKKIDG